MLNIAKHNNLNLDRKSETLDPCIYQTEWLENHALSSSLLEFNRLVQAIFTAININPCNVVAYWQLKISWGRHRMDLVLLNIHWTFIL